MFSILTTLFSFFSKTEAGAHLGAGISNAATFVALVPIVLSLYHWFQGHANDIALVVSVTWGEVSLAAAIVFAVVEVARATRPRGVMYGDPR